MVLRKKRETKRPLYVFLMMCIFTCIVYLGFNIKDGWIKYTEVKKRIDVSIETYDTLQEQYSQLQKEIEYENSATGQEAQIRTKFDFVKLDEQVVFIMHEERPQIIEEETKMQKFLNTFKNFFN